MQVTLKGIGLMRDYLGEAPRQVELPEGATLGDLLDRIELDFKEQLTGSIWNWEEHRFRGPVVIVSDHRTIKDKATPLQDQQEVSFYKALVGG
jgi:molybdopterin converting factor small subunit